MAKRTKKQNELGQEVSELKDRDTQPKVTIDEFGQLKRKKKSKNRTNSTNENTADAPNVDVGLEIIDTLKEYFHPRNRFEILRLVFFIIFWTCVFALLIVLCPILFKVLWEEITLGDGIFDIIMGSILVLCTSFVVFLASLIVLGLSYPFWKYFLWLARSLEDAIFNIGDKVIILILLFLVIVSFGFLIGITGYICVLTWF